jgi:hypothetical protein
MQIRTMLHPDLSSLVDYGLLTVGSRIAVRRTANRDSLTIDHAHIRNVQVVEAQYLVHLNPTYKSTRAGLLTRQLRILSFDVELARMPSSEAWAAAIKVCASAN